MRWEPQGIRLRSTELIFILISDEPVSMDLLDFERERKTKPRKWRDAVTEYILKYIIKTIIQLVIAALFMYLLKK